jgi:hypothetical protein
MGKRAVAFLAVAIFLITLAVPVYANDDLDNYKFRIDANWWFSQPSGYYGKNNTNNYFDIHRDFGFGSYSTFTGKIDWRFKRKHHFLLNVSPVNSTKTTTLNRTVEFEGQTYDIGAQVSLRIRSLNFAPGYEYDIIRRDHGFLGLEVDLNLLDTEAKLSGMATANGMTRQATASNSFFAPLPAVGPVFRWYPLRDSNRLSIDGSFRGMPFFGYGNFITARGSVGVGLTNHLALRAGYQLGSRLSVHGTSDQVDVELTQKGPTAGIEYSWGEAPLGKPRKTASQEPGANVISDWHVDWVPFYLWFSGLKGNVGAQGYVVPVDATFSDIFSELNIGLMTVLDVRRKRVGVLTDLVFMSLSSDQKSTPVNGGGYSGFTENSKTFWVDPELYYRVLDKEKFSADAVAGVRLWHLNNSFDLLPGTLPAVTVGQTQSWADPVLGARFRFNLNKGWFVSLKGDAGGFGAGSQLTWQVYTGVGKQFKQRYSLLLGYRYMDVDYKNGGFLYDTHMSGLLAGFAIRVK